MYLIYNGDNIEMMKKMGDETFNCCVTSPPYYGLRDYGVVGQNGLETTPDEYIDKIVSIFKEVKRVLKNDGTLWVNMGDSYGKNKQLLGIPWRLAFALQNDGWYLRQDIIWHKPNPMPESVTDRCTKAHEYIFLLTKSTKYYYDHESIKTESKEDYGTRNRKNGKYHNDGTGLTPHSGLENNYKTANKRSVWSVTTKPYKGAHFATFPPDLIEPCILAGCPVNGMVLDVFAGSGTVAGVCEKLNRHSAMIELNRDYCDLIHDRVKSINVK